MLALVIALSLASPDIPLVLPQNRDAARYVDTVDDVDVSGSDHEIVCIRAEATAHSRIRRPSACRSQGAWRQVMAQRVDDNYVLRRDLGKLSMDSFLVEEAVARAEENALRVEQRRMAALDR
jgi:hypothetical protein